MNNLSADIGYRSLNHVGEQLCGDHVNVVEQENGTIIAVLADGMGSGVKASILSTLTARIISTMLAAGLRLEDCVDTIAQTLPICSERGVAYSTFTIIQLLENERAILVQYDNPEVILLRDGKNYDYPRTEMTVSGKTISRSEIELQENDIFIAMSDGCVHAGVGVQMNFGWQRSNIIEFMETLYDVGFTAKTLTTILVDECNKLYAGEPGDDATALCIRIRRRLPINLLVGPPADRDDENRMLSLFFSKAGKHVVCGGTTSNIVSRYLDKPLRPLLDYNGDPDIPPMAELEGVDLVTEGIITISRVLEYAKNYLEDNNSYTKWSYQKDAASCLARLLFESSTDINLFVGKAVNPAHQNPDLPINFNIKMRLLDELADCLGKMGKRLKVSYF